MICLEKTNYKVYLRRSGNRGVIRTANDLGELGLLNGQGPRNVYSYTTIMAISTVLMENNKLNNSPYGQMVRPI